MASSKKAPAPPATSARPSPTVNPNKAQAKDDNFTFKNSQTICEVFGLQMATITVGSMASQKFFIVDKGFLCQKIPRFQELLTDYWIEMPKNETSLPEQDPHSFEALLGWVYRGELRPLDLIKDNNFYNWTWDPIPFYTLAQNLNLPHLQNTTMSLLSVVQSKYNLIFTPDSILRIYGATKPGCPLRRYATMQASWIILAHEKDYCREWSSVVIQGLFAARKDISEDVFDLMRASRGGVLADPRMAEKCEFHIHGNGEKCDLA